jgi:hypothetical protein
MSFVAILRRELIVSSRGGTIGLRAGSAALVALVVMAAIMTWHMAGWDRTSIAGLSSFARAVFGGAVAVQGVLTLMLVPDDVIRILVGERQRKTLDGLLTSRLSSGGIIMGVLTGGLARWVACLAAGLPVMLLMIPFLGIDPRVVLLAHAGLGATGFVLAGLALVVSLGARDSRRALLGTITLAFAWLFIPFLVVLLLPLFWPAGAAWVLPAARGLLDSSPAWLLATLLGLAGRGGLVAATTRMIACETAGALLLVAWAIVRLRPACRALADRHDRAFLFQHRHRPRRRPACGADPMLWKELHATRGPGLRDSLGVLLPILAGFSLGALYFARPAFHELIAEGYRASPNDASQPSSFFAWAFVLARGIIPAPGQARALFNLVLRDVTSYFGILVVLLTTEVSAKSIADERRQDTWAGLLATPLPANAILRAKMLGSVWKLRGLLALVIGLWSVGLLAGAVHPLSFVAAVALLVVSTGFVAVVGTTLSLRSSDWKRASERSILVLVLVTFSGVLPRLLPPRAATVLMGAGSIPLLYWLVLLSYNDVATALETGAFPQLALLAIDTGEGAMSVLATCLIGMAGQAAAAGFLFHAAVRRFDAAAGRPQRARGKPPLALTRPSSDKSRWAIAKAGGGSDNEVTSSLPLENEAAGGGRR